MCVYRSCYDYGLIYEYLLGSTSRFMYFFLFFPNMFIGVISNVETCISDVKHWMIEDKLQLNDEKTKCLLIRPNKCTLNLN